MAGRGHTIEVLEVHERTFGPIAPAALIRIVRARRDAVVSGSVGGGPTHGTQSAWL